MYLRFTENQFYMCTCNRYLVGVCWLCRHFQGELYIDIFDNAVKGILRKALNDAFRHICCCFISCTVLLYTRKYSLLPPPILILPLLVGQFKTGWIQISNYLFFKANSRNCLQVKKSQNNTGQKNSKRYRNPFVHYHFKFRALTSWYASKKQSDWFK